MIVGLYFVIVMTFMRIMVVIVVLVLLFYKAFRLILGQSLYNDEIMVSALID